MSVNPHLQEVAAKPLGLKKNFTWTLAGNIIYAGSQWGMLIVLAKLGSPEIVGRFALALAVTAPVIAFANLQLRIYQATDAANEYQLDDYLGLRIAMLVLAMLFVALTDTFSKYSAQTNLVILAIALAKGFESVSDVCQGYFQQHERMDKIAWSKIIKGVLSLVILGSLMRLTGNLLVASLGLAFSWAVVLLVYDMRNIDILSKGDVISNAHLRPLRYRFGIIFARFSLKTMRKLLQIALPLGFCSLLISLRPNIPRYFIAHYFGERELGFFAAAAYLMVAVTTVISALGESAAPRLGKYFVEGNAKALRKLIFQLMTIGFGIGLAGVLISMVAGKQIMVLAYSKEYGRYQDVLVLLMIATGIMSVATFLNYGMVATRRIKVQIPLFAIITGLTALGSALLIPRYGVKGAAFALILAAIVHVIGGLIITIKAMVNIKPHTGKSMEYLEESSRLNQDLGES